MPPSAGPSSRGFHRLALYAQCSQKWAFSELLKLEPIRESEPRAVGSLGHIGLMSLYLKRQGQLPANELQDPLESMRTAHVRIGWTFERVRPAYEAYVEWSSVNDRDFEILDVEREYRVRVSGALYTQRADLTVRSRSDSQVYFVDHKFLMSGQVDTLPDWRRMDGQNFGYEVIGRAVSESLYGSPFGGVFITLISTMAPYRIKRHAVPLPHESVRGHLNALAQLSIEVVAGEHGAEQAFDLRRYVFEQFPRTGIFSGACQTRYGACDYMPLCMRGRPALEEYITTSDLVRELRKGTGV